MTAHTRFMTLLVAGVLLACDLPPEFGGRMRSNFSEPDFAIQPGGGVTIYLSERVGVRLAADYRSNIDVEDGDWGFPHEFRALGGLTFGWGTR